MAAPPGVVSWIAKRLSTFISLSLYIPIRGEFTGGYLDIFGDIVCIWCHSFENKFEFKLMFHASDMQIKYREFWKVLIKYSYLQK